MKVLVCGGRDYDDEAAVWRALDAIDRKTRIDCVLHGACGWDAGDEDPDDEELRGADRWAHGWANARHRATETRAAFWRRDGRSAGPRRNAELLEARPDVVVAFPGGKGTADMIRRARKAGVRVVEVAPMPRRESQKGASRG